MRFLYRRETYGRKMQLHFKSTEKNHSTQNVSRSLITLDSQGNFSPPRNPRINGNQWGTHLTFDTMYSDLFKEFYDLKQEEEKRLY